MLARAIDFCVPVLVFVAMLVVGMELTADDFRRVARQPGVVLAATVRQLIALPAIAWVLLSAVRLQPSIAQGVLLVAACPSGAMANLYTCLARSNVALSVSLTAVSCLAGLLTTPVALGILQTHGGHDSTFGDAGTTDRAVDRLVDTARTGRNVRVDGGSKWRRGGLAVLQ